MTIELTVKHEAGPYERVINFEKKLDFYFVDLVPTETLSMIASLESFGKHDHVFSWLKRRD